MVRLLVGALWMVVASLGTSVLVALVKIASADLPTVEIIFFQSVIGVVCMLPYVVRVGWKPKKPWWQLVNGVAGACGYFFFFLALRYVPMVNVVLATNTAPLWIPLICWVVLKEQMWWVTWIGIVVGFVGIVVILHPGIVGFHPAIGFALITGLMIGTLLFAMRFLAHTDGPYLTLFYSVLITALMVLPFTVVNWKMPSGWIWLVLLGTGLVNGVLQVARIWSLQRGSVSIMGPIYFLTVPFTGVIGWIFWDHVPGWLFYVGAVLVIGGGIWTIETGRRHGS